jgi:hypothetical protein
LTAACTWCLATFPYKSFLVTKLATTFSEAAIQNAEKYPLQKSKPWRRTVAKATVLLAIEALNDAVQRSPHLLSVKEMNCQIETKPARKVTVNCDCDPDSLVTGSGIVLVPNTNNIITQSPLKDTFLKTEVAVEGEDEIVVLKDLFVDPRELALDAAKRVAEPSTVAAKDAFVELFWLIRRSIHPDECNMAIKQVDVVVGMGVSLRGVPPMPRSNKVKLPVMELTKPVKAGAELVCFYIGSGEQPLKRART